MIQKLVLSGCFSSWLFLLAFPQIPAIGNWREHLPYHQATGVTSSAGKIWCATPYSLYSVDPRDNSMERFSKVSGLHETGISCIRYDGSNDKLIIAYKNSNIDILSGKNIFNIPDIKQKAIPGNKTIYGIFVYGQRVYLSTALGLIVLDENKYEVRDIYIIGNNGDSVAVNALSTDGNFYYAATAEGLKQAPVNSPGLADFHNWTLLNGKGGPSPGPCRDVASMQNLIFALQNDSLFLFRDTSNSGGSGNPGGTGTPGSGVWHFFYSDSWLINSLSISAGKLMICEQKSDSGRVLVMGPEGRVEKMLQHAGFLQNPRQALIFGNDYWVADSVKGLSAWPSPAPGISPTSYIPNSPLSLAGGEMSVNHGVLWAAAGGADDNWAPLNNKNGLYRLSEEGWTNYSHLEFPRLDSIFDFVSVAVSPQDNSLWAGSFGKGLLQLNTKAAPASNNFFTIYAKNSPVSPVQGSPSVYRVSGLSFDPDGRLWIANYGAAGDLLVRKADGSWKSFLIPFAHMENAVSQILVDDYSQEWIVSPKGNGLFCYNHGPSIDNISDDQWKFYRSGSGNGNLPDNNVYCIAKDKNGFIWIGTANGIGVIQCPQHIFNAGGCEAVRPIVQFDNFAGYLFSGEQVQAIAVDGANRKWIGTRNGVWLISPDAEKIVYHFTESSSPLLNNNVKRIAIDPETGEVFFATAAGICSFRAEATEGGVFNSNVLVFPNPVPPDYSGTIAIRGLVDNAIVKITELNGRLVFQTRALGGQAVWDGKDYRGRPISTGVYLVLVSDDARQEKLATKIVVVGK
jgi:streptogramin lyase